jgi:hypothetical protein
MTRKLKFILLLAVLTTCNAFPQASPVNDPLLDKMTGRWVLHGTIAGQETTHDVVIQWALGHQYIMMTEISREKDEKGIPQYEAIVYITREDSKSQYSCMWLDNTGNGGLNGQSVGHSPIAPDMMKFLFIVPGNDDFQTTFRYNAAGDSWLWFMDSLGKNKTEVFARLTMTRNK